jgi:hypothetical protein
MKKFILVIVAAFLLTSCGVSLVAYDDYYDSYPYPSYYFYYGGRAYYYYDYHYVPGWRYRPTPPPPKPKPHVKPAPPRHDPPAKPNRQPRTNNNDRAVRPSVGNHGGAPSRSGGGTRGRR